MLSSKVEATLNEQNGNSNLKELALNHQYSPQPYETTNEISSESQTCDDDDAVYRHEKSEAFKSARGPEFPCGVSKNVAISSEDITQLSNQSPRMIFDDLFGVNYPMKNNSLGINSGQDFSIKLKLTKLHNETTIQSDSIEDENWTSLEIAGITKIISDDKLSFNLNPTSNDDGIDDFRDLFNSLLPNIQNTILDAHDAVKNTLNKNFNTLPMETDELSVYPFLKSRGEEAVEDNDDLFTHSTILPAPGAPMYQEIVYSQQNNFAIEQPANNIQPSTSNGQTRMPSSNAFTSGTAEKGLGRPFISVEDRTQALNNAVGQEKVKIQRAINAHNYREKKKKLEKILEQLQQSKSDMKEMAERFAT